ncbi:hypothetical protein CHS0354_024546 [Potamilus streckersoni]|uniref:IgGFc-binding protein N-terminal domain-containing protein n=1 Tax=Potamilus streckersoni TaxID=2493646 RepID=A0AAE0TN97_9BIVA|nr:hypothetical protein CHS0354_024546 [Potamilus streckersoni]
MVIQISGWLVVDTRWVMHSVMLESLATRTNKQSLMTWSCLVVIVLQTIAQETLDSKGKEFIFATPLCTGNTVYVLVIPQSTETVNVTISAQTQESSEILPGHVFRSKVQCMELEWGQVSTSVIKLFTTQEVTVYVEYSEDNYLVFPVDSYGSSYTVAVATSEARNNSYFVVISKYNTTINITLSEQLMNQVVSAGSRIYSSGSMIYVVLHENEVFSIQCSCNLSGTTIISADNVTVLAGSFNMLDSNYHIIEQLLPMSTWGQRYIFSKNNWVSENISVILIGKGPPTMTTIFLKDEVIQQQLLEKQPLYMYLKVIDYVAIETNSSVLCVLSLDTLDLQNGRHGAMIVLTPLALFHSQLHFMADAGSILLDLILQEGTNNNIFVNQTNALRPFERPLLSVWGMFLVPNLQIDSPYLVKTVNDNRYPFFSSITWRKQNSCRIYNMGMRITSIYDACVKTTSPNGGNGDGIDNDCDNRIDEELHNGKDDDLDSLIDEDTVFSKDIEQSVPRKDATYVLTHYQEETYTLSASVLSVVVSIIVAILAVVCFISGMFLADRLRRGPLLRPSRVSPAFNT